VYSIKKLKLYHLAASLEAHGQFSLGELLGN